jgi:hypothetical protein
VTPEAMFKRGERRLAARRLADREAVESSAEVVRLEAALADLRNFVRLLMYCIDATELVKLMAALEVRRDKAGNALDSVGDGRAIN